MFVLRNKIFRIVSCIYIFFLFLLGSSNKNRQIIVKPSFIAFLTVIRSWNFFFLFYSIWYHFVEKPKYRQYSCVSLGLQTVGHHPHSFVSSCSTGMNKIRHKFNQLFIFKQCSQRTPINSTFSANKHIPDRVAYAISARLSSTSKRFERQPLQLRHVRNETSIPIFFCNQGITKLLILCISKSI